MNIENLKEKARAHEWDEEWALAISLYQQALDGASPDEAPDTALYNRVGDLQVRMGNLNGAIDNYLTAADLYLEAELPNAAIAICRKILRNAPNRAEVFLKMGQIRAAQGFLTDARQNFLTYAERKQQAGDLEEAFRALVEFVDLAPDDTEIRRALADRLLAHDRPDDALEQYRSLFFQFAREGKTESGEEVEKIIRSIDEDADLKLPVDPPVDPPGWGELQKSESGQDEMEPGLVTEESPISDDGGHLGGFETTALIEPTVDDSEDSSSAREVADGADDDADGPDDESVERNDHGIQHRAIVTEARDDSWMEGVLLVAPTPDESTTDNDLTANQVAADVDGSEGVPGPDSVEAVDGATEYALSVDDDLAPLDADGSAPEAHDEPDSNVPEHEMFAANGDWGSASDALAQLTEEDPEDISLRQRAVEYAFRAHEPTRLAGAYLGLAEALQASGQEEKARAVFRQVVSVDPENATAREALGEGATAEDSGSNSAAEVASSEDYVDLGALILGEEEERTTRWTVKAAEPSGDEAADFAEMLVQFKAKVAAHVDIDDIRAHFDLGTAYKDMGLLDEAVEEFQLALRADAHHLPTHEVLGETFLEKGDAQIAVHSLERAVNIPRDVEDDMLGIFYYLGRAHEDLGNRDSAREFYERAFSLDINFRDVTDRLRQLR